MPSFLSLLLLALLLGLTAAGSLDRVSIDHDVTTSTYVIRRGDFSSPPIQQDLRLFFKLARINVPEDATAFPEVVHEAYLAEIQKQYPLVPEQLTYVPKAKAAGTYLVQFKTQVLPEYREALAELGAIVRFPFPSQSLLITLKDASRLHEIRNLKVVNWIGDYLPLYKFGADVLHLLAANHLFSGKVHFSVMLVERGAAMQDRIANIIEKELGGEMVLTVRQGFRLEAKLTASQLLQLLAQPEVLYIDVAGQPGTDMNIARISGGLDYISSVAGYNGEGVRAEVMDSGLHVSHGDFKPLNIIIHGGNSLSTSHGSSVFGIVFGAGQVNPKALGALSKAEACIFATYNLISSSYTRYTHTAQLVDPTGPYRAVFQTNSWGNSQTTAYTTLSAEFDDILFINDIAILQSQSNTGNRNSRPEAWAKNIISVGAFYHHDTISKSDDAWDGGASIGPAEDGRQKPDLCNYYDDILTTNASDSGYTQFGGTSGATPITAGHVGIFFQMWADGVFSGRVGQANDVFEVRPHMSTTKAVMINTATQFQFNAESTDLKRVHQGWGVANVATIYDVAMMHGWKFPVLVDETDPITPFEVVSYTVTVHRDDVDTYLKATLVYRDPMPPVSASKQLINNIDLKVTSPSGVVYWGNYGLNEGPCSKPDGAPSSVDNVENVVICLVESGTYTISVHGTEIIEDTYPENSVLDAVYSLVVTKGKNS